MKLYIMSKSYDSYGAHTTISPIGSFLLDQAPAVGEAINEITVTLYFEDRGPPRSTLETLFAKHVSYRASLPKITFFRARRKVSIDVASQLMNGRDWKPSPRMSLPLFKRGVDEVISALCLLRTRLKTTDAFDLPAFLAHCEGARQRIPETEDALQTMGDELRAADKRAFEALSPWDQLDIDWSEFHPQAKTVLDDPFFWESANDLAPHGNDTGADLLAAYKTWLKRHPDGQPLHFLERLSVQWGYSQAVPMDEGTRAEADIALAFADLKLRGHCDPQVRENALAALTWQQQHAEPSSDLSGQESLAAIERQRALLSRCT